MDEAIILIIDADDIGARRAFRRVCASTLDLIRQVNLTRADRLALAVMEDDGYGCAIGN